MDDSDLAQRVALVTRLAAEISEAASEFATNAFEELIDKTTSGNWYVRHLAASRLVASDYHDPRALPVFVRLMDDPSPLVRASAAMGLSNYVVEQSRDVLVDHLRHDVDANVRATCVHSLGTIGGADDEIIAALSDPDWHVRMTSAVSLGHLGNPAASPHIARLLEEPLWTVRYFACTALLDLGVSSIRVIETLSDLREIPEAREHIQWFKESHAMEKAMGKFPQDFEQFDDDASEEQVLDVLRQKYGDEAVARPSTDPIDDLIEQAWALLGGGARQQMDS